MPISKSRLRSFPLLNSLDTIELDRLTPLLQERHYPASSIVFEDGKMGDRLYLLESGRVEIVKPSPNGSALLNVLPPGSFFGELSLLDDQPHSATARAARASTTLEMPKAVFLSLIQRFPLLLFHTAVENAERLRRSDRDLIDELVERNQELGELYGTSLDISRHLELEQALTAIVARAVSLLKSARGTLHLYDSGKNLLMSQPPLKTIHPGEGATGRAFVSGEPVIVNASNGQPHALAAPIALDAASLGALTVYRPPSASPFDADDARLLLLLANQAAIAIENARLFALAVEKGHLDGELSAARQVQRSLIPTRAPRIPGFQISGWWRPAREVAGDFYDYFPLTPARWCLLIADVSDKGVPAAIFMANARSVLRASAAVEPDPARALTRANQLLAADAANGMFVTVFFGILDAAARRFTYSNGGHNPPLLWRGKTRRLERLSRHSLALGISPDASYTTGTVDLRLGDLLLLYTDGVTEAVNGRGHFFGDARLARIVKRNASAPATAVVHAIDRGVREFIGAQPLGDDVTVVAVRASPS